MQSTESIHQALFSFVEQSPDTFHGVKALTEQLKAEGYTQLQEGEDWQLEQGGKYMVTRNQSSLIAFRLPQKPHKGIMIAASHSDTPALKLKPDAGIMKNGHLCLNTAPYGGLVMESWLDRPLSLSGRVTVATQNGVESHLVHIDRDLLVIPRVAPHLKSAKEEGGLNPQTDMIPLLAMGGEEADWLSLIGEEIGVLPDAILDTDLFVHCRSKGTLWGKEEEFLSAPRLDDLLCVFASLQGFLAGGHEDSLPVLAVFDNEEVGSSTWQGALSTFLHDVLLRLHENETDLMQKLANSMMLSCDNGHACHPNHGEKADPKVQPKLNGGVLLKYSANQKYTTDAIAGGLVKTIAKKAGVRLQPYVNRSDIPGGSTLGNLSNQQVSVKTADIGAAQLAMHAAWETAGAKDAEDLCRLLEAFYSTCIVEKTDGTYDVNMK